MATIHVSKDKESIEPDKKVRFYIEFDKAEEKLLDQDFVSLSVPAGSFEFKACFSGWFEEPTSIEKLIMAPGTSIHFQVFFDKKLRLREIDCVSTISDSAKDGTEKPISATPPPSLEEQRTGILVSTLDKIPSLGFKNVGYALWLDGTKYEKRLDRGQIFVPLSPGSHTFQGSMWPNNTHKFYFLLKTGQQLHYQIWSAAKCIHGARMIGYEGMFDDKAGDNK